MEDMAVALLEARADPAFETPNGTALDVASRHLPTFLEALNGFLPPAQPTPSHVPEKAQAPATQSVPSGEDDAAAFFEAVEADDIATAQQYLPAMANARNVDGDVALSLVASAGMVEALAAAGADANASNEQGETPLFFASVPEVIKALAAVGADTNR